MLPVANESGSHARFQARLLEILSETLTAEEILERLNADPSCAEFRDYIATFEPRMVEVAAALVKKWGRREG